MASSKHLHPLTTSHHNRSLSNVSATSDACTFHSAHDHPPSSSSHMEMRPLTSSTSQPFHPPSSPTKHTPLPSPKLEAIKMSRQDSGYQETSPRTSTSSRHSSHASSSHPSKPKRRSTTESKTSTSNPRPNPKRGSRSSQSAAQIRTSISNGRPSLSSRHTSPFPRTDIQNINQPYKFFQFPVPVLTSSPPSEPEPESTPLPPPPPPATTQYWTSDQTRRLEYAAIDAAGKGVRGFFIRLVPDCILPPATRRTRFCGEDGDAASDAGSVRRYRLCLPEEKEGGKVGVKERRQGLWRRITGAGRERER